MKKRVRILLPVLALLTVAAPIAIINSQKISTVEAKNTVATTKVVKNSPVPGKNVNERLAKALVLYVGSTQALVNNAEKQIDKNSTDVKPVVKNDRTLVPVRFISENIGAQVVWNASNQTVKVTLNGKEVEMVIGKTTMNVNGKAVALDSTPEVIGGRTFIPLRQLSEALGKKVFYDRGLIVISDEENILNTKSEKGSIDNIIAKVNNLPVVGSFEKLKGILAISNNNYNKKLFRRSDVIEVAPSISQDAVTNSAKAKAESTVGADTKEAGTSADYSKTNVQVQGVDEADVVKTDGKYIYQVNKDRIIIANAYPAENMKVIGKLSFSDKKAVPLEIFIDEKYMSVIAAGTNNQYEIQEGKIQNNYDEPYREMTKVFVYDITDKENIKSVRELEIEGRYISSRKIGSVLYLITNKNVYINVESVDGNVTPYYRDSAVKDEFIKIDYKDIRYFPNSTLNNYMIIGAIDLKNINEEAKVSTYLGAGENIYSSTQNLYISMNNYYNYYRTLPVNTATNDSKKVKVSSIRPMGNSTATTDVYKFSLNNSQVTYINKGEVPGTILNQFSMDENDGYFRIATTVGEVWSGNSKNNVYILDDILNIKGKLEDIAPGEKIYSTRFMGDRCYMVTFKKVDPLFVIDLKNPQEPKILGALKIPGYSDYLHPYDENHIIGFGKDTEAYGETAFYQGMKIAIFDVTDVTKPVEMFKEIIGDRGTDSELLRNHKALLFSKEKNLLAFPVSVFEVTSKKSGQDNLRDITEYGAFTFQGAYVYNIDLKNGFSLKGKITHISNEEMLKSGYMGSDGDNNINRILYIGDTLYTLSNSRIKANNLQDLKEKNSLEVK